MDNLKALFSTELGKRIYERFLNAVDTYDMRTRIENGVLVGLSGGADSVMLLLLLLHYRKNSEHFPIVAVHINHGIRGDEAERDEQFSVFFAQDLGVEIIVSRVDCPQLREQCGGSLEEVARNARYSEFSKIIQGRNDLGCIAVAHNADDNVETVLFNLMRGAGTAGVAGIPPVRDDIVRPMILLKKSDIIALLVQAGVSYVTDSTNFETEYSRNYIRNNIVPVLAEYSEHVYDMTARASFNLRCDNDFIEEVANKFLLNNKNCLLASDISALHPAVRYRVIKQMAQREGCRAIEATHIFKIAKLLSKSNFSYSLPNGFAFVCERRACSVVKNVSKASDFCIQLNENITEIPEFSAMVVISDTDIAKTFSNVYKFSIQADLSSAIIDSGIYVRNRKDGDSYRYGGITHKLKKLFNDRKITLSARDRIPVFYDKKGVLWVPGFGVRDDGATSNVQRRITLLWNDSENGFFIPKR